jgi:hypothetical protein
MLCSLLILSVPDTYPTTTTTTFAYRIKLSVCIKHVDMFLTNELPG